MIGGTAGRTTLNGEGLQHQDGHSLVNAIAYPTVRAYDPAFGYEIAVIIMEGMKKLYEEGETAIYYLMAGNENYVHPEMPEGVEDGIMKGAYKFSSKQAASEKHRATLLGSGAIMNCAIEAQTILAEEYDVSTNLYSVTSYTELRRDAATCERWNLLNPDESPKASYIETLLADEEGPCIAASDYIRALPEQISSYVPGGLYALGTDGMGRSETRKALRRHFEVDAQFITLATLRQLQKRGELDASVVAQAIEDLEIDPHKANPYFA